MNKRFIWGVSTSSYQIEGASLADGRIPSIWDTFAKIPGAISDNSDGTIACEHYHRYPEDIELMKKLGVQAYRFSVAWPRVFDGKKLNLKGMDFYKRLVDALLTANIEPWLCLYHWDLPQVLQDKGGWANREITQLFVEYALAVCEKLSDRVKYFAMINEGNVIAWLGHMMGLFAPGLRDDTTAFAAAHHLNLAQGMALQALRSYDSHLKLGSILSLTFTKSLTDTPEDKIAADYMDALWNGSFLDPLFFGKYPTLLKNDFAPHIKNNDLNIIHQPIDFLGINYYSTTYAQAPNKANGLFMGKYTNMAWPPAGKNVTIMNWEIAPEDLYAILLRLKNEYNNPAVFITENGAAFADNKVIKDQIQDQDRIEFFKTHLAVIERAKAQGANVCGYFIWTLLDNFEWTKGYTRYFGIVHVDRATQKRTPKASFDWYSRWIKEEGAQWVKNL